MITRTLFDAEYDTFCESVRRFIDTRVLPHHKRWEDQGYIDRVIWEKAAAAGYHCTSMPEAYGGAGADTHYSIVLTEEIARVGATGLDLGLHSEVVAPYPSHYGSETLKRHHLPKLASVEMIGAIAMTEPGAGSDSQDVRTTATRGRGGSHYVLSGSKIFITNGWHADVVIVVARTMPEGGAKGTGLFVVDISMEGFGKGKRLKKVGMKAQDTAELFFDNVRLPAGNLLGEEHHGFAYLMQKLPWERLRIAITAIASTKGALEWALRYVRERQAFGKSILDFQTARHALAELKTEVQIGRVFVDQYIVLKLADKLDAATASMAKYWTTDLQFKVMGRCVQLHGGYGYMWEYPIVCAQAGSRVQQIYGGANEIMKGLIARTL